MADQIQQKISNELKEILIQLFKDVGVPADIGLKKSSHYFYKNNTYTETRTFTPTRKLKPQEDGIKTKFEETIKTQVDKLRIEGKDEVATQLQSFVFELELNLGDKFISVTGLERLTFKEDQVEGVDSDYNHEDGQVTLVDFWATWCGPCQNPMQHNEEMLKTNSEKWAGKAKIVAISFDGEQDGLVKRINEKDWKHIDHYRMKKGWDGENKALQILKINGIPFVTLLDRNGKVVYMGHPSECKIEDEINRLISDTQEVIKDQSAAPIQEDQELIKSQKEQFIKSKNFLRTNWKDFLVSMNNEVYDEYFDLKLIKSSNYDTQGKKSHQKKEKLEIQYKVKEAQKKYVEDGVQLIKTTLKEESYEFKKEMICDPQQEFKNHLKFLNDTANKYNLPTLELVVEQTNSISIHQTDGVETQEYTRVCQGKNMPANLSSKARQIAEEMEAYMGKNQETNIEQFSELLNEGFNFSLSVGDKYNDIINVHAPNKFDETLTISHVQGQVLIVDFWAHWCGPCVKGLDANTDLFLANKEKWDGKLRIIGLALEDEESSKEIIQAKPKWSEIIEFFYCKDGRKNDAPSTYQVQSIPHYVIVGKDGIIRSLGSCKNLEQTVNDLISEEPVQQKEKVVEIVQGLTQDQSQNLLEFIKNKENFTKLHSIVSELTKNTFKLELSFTSVFKLDPETGNQELKQGNKPSLTYWIRENKKSTPDDFLKTLFKIVPKDQLTIDETLSKTVDIPFPGVACALCLKVLDDNTPQYYSPFTKVHYCTECAESFDDSKKGQERYKVKDTLVYIHAPRQDKDVLLNIDEYIFGENVKLPDSAEGSQVHDFSCNGGGRSSEGPRYIAISCRPGFRQENGYVDLCSDCFIKIKENKEDGQKILEKNKDENLSTDSIFLRVLFYHGYFKY